MYEHEFDLTLCQEIAVEHGFLVPMNLCFPHGANGWPVRAIPLQVNVIAASAADRAPLLPARAGAARARSRAIRRTRVSW